VQLSNSFEVAAPIDEVFGVILDVERVVGCVPGAEIVERISDDAFRARITVRVGPVKMQYRSDVEIVERDAVAHRAAMRIQAKESRGQGTAEATARLTLTETDGRTHGVVDVEMQVSGRVASMGQGAIQDVSNRLVSTFAVNLGQMFDQSAASSDEQAAPAESVPEGKSPVPEATGATRPADPSAPPGPSSPAGSTASDDSLSALSLVGAVVGGRLRNPRVVGVLVAVVALLGFIAGRARRA
jgi:carbon monoxide dehydrogenase subunit G